MLPNLLVDSRRMTGEWLPDPSGIWGMEPFGKHEQLFVELVFVFSDAPMLSQKKLPVKANKNCFLLNVRIETGAFWCAGSV